MKKLLSTVLALSIGSASAAETTPMTKNFYVKAEAGKSWLESFSGNGSAGDYLKAKPENNFTYGAAVGYNFAKGFRADLNGQVRCLNYKASGSIASTQIQQRQQTQSYSLFLNGSYEIETGSIFTPYVTVGVGYAYNKAGELVSDSDAPEVTNFKAPGKNASNFAWNIGVGTAVKLGKSVDLDITYRYLDLGKIAMQSTTAGTGRLVRDVKPSSQSIKAHQLTVGLVYKL